MSSSYKGALNLTVAVLIAFTVLMLANRLTEDRINQARVRMMQDNLSAVLPAGPFDQHPLESVKEHRVPALGADQPVKFYTAYRNAQPAAAVLELLAPDGYSGNIRLLLGLHADGRIVAVRVIEHRETPGLGDGIEYRKSPWITQFDGQAIDVTEPVDWQVRQSGGHYDALTGATITSRAVIQSIHRTLQWFEQNSDQVFAQ